MFIALQTLSNSDNSNKKIAAQVVKSDLFVDI